MVKTPSLTYKSSSVDDMKMGNLNFLIRLSVFSQFYTIMFYFETSIDSWEVAKIQGVLCTLHPTYHSGNILHIYVVLHPNQESDIGLLL
jgi:hypothetical protein